jgi:hypothetical protein
MAEEAIFLIWPGSACRWGLKKSQISSPVKAMASDAKFIWVAFGGKEDGNLRVREETKEWLYDL